MVPVAHLCVALCALVYGGALVSAQRASAPAPSDLAAAAPAQGNPGDRTATSGPYTYTVTPTISVPGLSTSASSYLSLEGSIASAGSINLYSIQSGLVTAQISNPPYPVNVTVRAQRSYLTDAFGGAACISYRFSSNVSTVSVGIADADQYLDSNYTTSPARIPFTICGASNCSSSSTYALNASAGHYIFDISNPSNSSANLVLSYVLYPANSSACQGLSNASQVPTPYTQTTSNITTPPLKSTAVVYFTSLSNDGHLSLVGSVRNTSCVTAVFSLNSTYRSGRIPLPSPAILLLLDQKGLEDYNDPKVARLTPTGGCQAGNTTANCAFTASGLVPGQAYHLLLAYAGNSSASGDTNDATVTVTYATNSSAGNCSNLISTNATNGGFLGFVTSSTSSSPGPVSPPPSSPSTFPSPPGAPGAAAPSGSSRSSPSPSPMLSPTVSSTGYDSISTVLGTQQLNSSQLAIMTNYG